MEIQTLSITLGNYCNADCKFCISKTTYNPSVTDSTEELMKSLDKAFRFALFNRINTLLITSKGEATLYWKELKEILPKAREYQIPIIEIQTNGIVLEGHKVKELKELGLTGIAISACDISPAGNKEIMRFHKEYNYWDVVREIVNQNLLCRLSVSMIKGKIDKIEKCEEMLENARKFGVHQVTFRELGIPNVSNPDNKSVEVIEWIKDNKVVNNEIYNYIKSNYPRIRRLSWGAEVYDCFGISVCVSDCMQQKPVDDSIRTIILQPDGHLYHSWEYKGSILF